jgi:hypothetical protein
VVISWRWSSWNSSIKQGQQSVLWWQIEFNLTIDYRCGVKNSWWSCGHRNDYLPIYNLWIDVLESTWIQGFVPYYEFYIIEDKLMTKINGLKNIAHWHHAYSKLYGLFHLTCLGNERVRKQTRGSCHLNPPRKKAWTFFFFYSKNFDSPSTTRIVIPAITSNDTKNLTGNSLLKHGYMVVNSSQFEVCQEKKISALVNCTLMTAWTIHDYTCTRKKKLNWRVQRRHWCRSVGLDPLPHKTKMFSLKNTASERWFEIVKSFTSSYRSC